MRADLFEFANIAFLLVFGSKQGPDLGDLVTLNIKKSGPFRRVEPLVQRRAEVVAVQVFLFEIKLRERVRAVDDRFDAVTAGHLTYGFHRRDLAGDIYLMSNLNQARARRNGPFKRGGDLLDVLGGNWNFY